MIESPDVMRKLVLDTRDSLGQAQDSVAVQEVATGQLVRRWTCEMGEIKHVLLAPPPR